MFNQLIIFSRGLSREEEKLFSMQKTHSKKPTVFSGWQDLFPPLNLNFTNCIWRYVVNSTTFIVYINTTWQSIQANRFLSAMHLLNALAVVVVCRKAYVYTYNHVGLIKAIPDPSIIGSNQTSSFNKLNQAL